jgi:hypothetical protein
MNNLNFRIQGQTELHQGSADIIASNDYTDLVHEAESAFDGDVTIRKIGSIKSAKYSQEGYIDAYDIYETYEDSGSTDYYYYALATHSQEL